MTFDDRGFRRSIVGDRLDMDEMLFLFNPGKQVKKQATLP